MDDLIERKNKHSRRASEIKKGVVMLKTYDARLLCRCHVVFLFWRRRERERRESVPASAVVVYLVARPGEDVYTGAARDGGPAPRVAAHLHGHPREPLVRPHAVAVQLVHLKKQRLETRKSHLRRFKC
jgi:hypothetical protein